jgi:hypothetical protein
MMEVSLPDRGDGDTAQNNTSLLASSQPIFCAS